MRFLSNAHTHTTYGDGQSTIAQTVEAARKLGFLSLGFSEHGDQGFDFDYSMSSQSRERYIAELRALQAAAATLEQAPRLWLGVEEEALTPDDIKNKNRREMDYILGSTHYVEQYYRGQSVAADGDPALLRQYVNDQLDGDGLALARRYYEGETDYLLQWKPDIIGHFDLVRMHALAHGFFDPDSAAYRRVALDALERAFPCGGVLEVNTGAMARDAMDAPYPTLELLGAWRELGGRVTLSSDCHNAEKLDYAFDIGLKLIARAGFAHIWRLGRGGALWEEERVALQRC